MARARILAVDDQRYFRELIAGMLSEEGFEVQTAASGEEALQLLERADFDIVLTDLVMPGMDGSDLVHRIKERSPEQDVVVVTGVVDVKTAVDAMKLGANDYLLKPFDRRTLTVTLESILQSTRLKLEHARLLAENIEYIGERSVYERALSLFSTLAVEPLAMRILDALCLETRAQGAVIWVAGDGGEVDQLDLIAARGLVRLSNEPESLPIAGLPEALRDDGRTCFEVWGSGETQQPALYAKLQREGRVMGLVRLTDKLEGGEFDTLDVLSVEKMLHFAEVALANAFKVRSLERRGLEDAVTGAYRMDYFRTMVRGEVEKSSRFGRHLALVRLDPGMPRELEGQGDDGARAGWLKGVATVLKGLLRATDLLAIDDSCRFYMLLPESDALGATVLKRRTLDELLASEAFAKLEASDRPEPLAGIAVYPTDGSQFEALLGSLEARVNEVRESRTDRPGLDRMPLGASLEQLLRRGEVQRPEMAQQIARFVLSEVGRHPRGRGLLYTAPGTVLADAVRQGLEGLRNAAIGTELVVIGDGARTAFETPSITWVPTQRAVGIPACLVHYGDGPAYALICEEARPGSQVRVFHTDERNLVEHLAFRLREELHAPAKLREVDR